MAGVTFPPDPQPGDVFTSGDSTWAWDGSKWVLQPPSMIMTAGKGELLIGNEDGLVECLPAGQENQRLVADVHAPQGATWVDVESADVLALLLPVDGAGSDLDADKVDGLHATDIYRQANPKGSAGATYVQLPGVICPYQLVSASPQPDTDYLMPFVVLAQSVTVVGLQYEVTTAHATNTLRLGIIRTDASYQGVGAPLFDSGNLSCAALGVKQAAVPSLVLPPGFYAIVGCCSGASVNIGLRGVYAQPLTGCPMNPTSTGLVPQNLVITRPYGPFPADMRWSTIPLWGIQGMRYFAWLALA